MQEVRNDARESAKRSLEAAIASLMDEDFQTAAALFRSGAAYLERVAGQETAAGEFAYFLPGRTPALPGGRNGEARARH